MGKGVTDGEKIDDFEKEGARFAHTPPQVPLFLHTGRCLVNVCISFLNGDALLHLESFQAKLVNVNLEAQPVYANPSVIRGASSSTVFAISPVIIIGVVVAGPA